MSQRLPVVGSDDDTWGSILNGFLAVSLNSDGTVASNTIGSAQIQNNAVGTNQLATSAITSTQIAAGAVGTSAIANNAVTNAQLDTTTQNILTSVASKYVKPGGGIPSTDLDAYSQTALANADTAIQSTLLGAASGVATLDSGSHLTAGQLPASVVTDSSGTTKAINSTGVANGNILVYSSGSGKWIPGSASSGSLAIGDGISGSTDSALLVTDSSGNLASGVASNSVITSSTALGGVLSGNLPNVSDPSVINVLDPTYGAKADALRITYTLASNSVTVTLAGMTASASWVGMKVVGPGIPIGATVATASNGGSSFTLSTAAPGNAWTNMGGSLSSLIGCIYTTDNTATIQAAINAANALYLAGGGVQTVLIPNGGYFIGNMILHEQGINADLFGGLLMLSGVYLTSSGQGRATIYANPPALTISEGGGSPQAISGGTINVISTAGFTATGSVQGGDGSSFTYTGLTGTSFTGCSGSGNVSDQTHMYQTIGDWIGNETALLITQASVTTSNFGIRGLILDGSQYMNAEANNAKGIAFLNCTDFSIEDNEIRYFGGKGIELAVQSGVITGTAQRFRICRNDIHDTSSNGIGMDGNLIEGLIDGNFIHDATMVAFGGGLESMVGGRNLLRTQISHNIIDNFGTVDVAGTDVLFFGNYINQTTNAAGPCINLDQSGVRVRVIGNFVDATPGASGQAIYGAGIYTDSEVSDNTVLVPAVTNYHSIGISGSTSTWHVIGNNINCPSGPIGYSFSVGGLNLIVNDNRLEQLSGGGMSVGATGLATVRGNIINGGRLGYGGSGGVVADNIINGPAATGIYAFSITGNHNSITGNNLVGNQTDNSSASLQMTNASNNQLSGNTFRAVGSGRVLVWEQSSAVGNNYTGNYLDANGQNVAVNGISASSVFQNNLGFNPVGSVVVAVPSSGSPVAAAGYDRTFYITANASGTTTIEVGTGPTITIPAIACVAVFVPAAVTMTPAYTNAPTWFCYGN